MTELARIENGVLLDRIAQENLEASGLPPEWYTPIVKADHPGQIAGQGVCEVPSIAGNTLYIQYTTYELSVPALLALLNSLGSGDYYDQTLAVLWQRAESLVEKKLNTWAATRGYNGIDRLVSYATSAIGTRAQEATDGVHQRDVLYDAYFTYVTNVKNGTLPVPTRVSDIEAKIPDPVWSV
jgi:hypothetical protein